MSLFVHISEQCIEDAKKHSLKVDIEKLRVDVINDQNLLRFKPFPPPFLKRKIAYNYRLIASYYPSEDDILVEFMRILPRSDAEYEEFIKNPIRVFESLMLDEEAVKAILNELKQEPFFVKPRLGDVHNLYLYDVFNQKESTLDEDFVLESREWLDLVHNSEVRNELRSVWRAFDQSISDQTIYSNINEFYESDEGRFGFLGRYFPENKILFLIAPIDRKRVSEEEKARIIAKYDNILQEEESVKLIESCKRRSIRTYPMYLIGDSDLWIEIQKDSKDASTSANLALSPEELGVLQSVMISKKEKSFPLFINGRPGSGKSTLLQYIYSEYYYYYHSKITDKVVNAAPIYLTYSEDLKQDAIKQITSILNKHHDRILLGNNITSVPVYCFDEFILDHAVKGSEFDYKFRPAKKITYKEFRPRCEKYIKTQRNLKHLSPGLVWHTIRTYIKGMSNGEEYLTPDEYKTIPVKRKTVSDKLYEVIYEKVFESWYLKLMNDGYWDHQDLTQVVLEHGLYEGRYPAIFCDESQDFTRIELELIYRLSVFSNINLTHAEMQRVPLVFAGDPFQTLNPTGFKWETVKDLFNETILTSLDPLSKGKLEFNYWPLTYNYRSSAFIVNFCNFILLCRSILFNEKDVKPQQTWGESSADFPRYLNINEIWVQEKLLEQSNITFIVPCDEGSEIEYAKSDAFLSQFIESDVSRVNILSPIRAKGLQFPRVVLYKFSNEAPSILRRHGLLFSEIASQIENDLEVEYFLNKLYVSASRPQKQLFILEENDYDKNTFWNFARRKDFDAILDENNINHINWIDNDGLWLLSHLENATASHRNMIDTDKENPLEIADQLREDGKRNRDSQMLRTAAKQYMQAGSNQNYTQAKDCEANAFYYDEKYLEAGELFIKIGNYRSAIEAYWNGGLYKKISEMDDLYIDSECKLYKTVALFMNGDKNYESCNKLLSQIGKSLVEYERLKAEMLYDDKWDKVIESLVLALSKMELEREKWDIILKQLSVLGSVRKGLPHKEYGIICFNAGSEEQAYQEWCRVPGFSDQRFTRLKTKYGKFVERLEAHYKLAEYDKVYELFSSSSADDKTITVINTVNLAIVKLDDMKTEFKFKKRYRRDVLQDEPYKYLNEISDLLDRAIGNRVDGDFLLEIATEYLEYARTNEDLPAGYNFVKRVQKVKKALNNHQQEYCRNLLLFHLITTNDSAVSNFKMKLQKNELEGFLKDSKIYKDSLNGDYEKLLIVGAIFDKMDRIRSSIEYFENFWKNPEKFADLEDMVSEKIIEHARIRWVAAKKRLYNYNVRKVTEKGETAEYGANYDIDNNKKDAKKRIHEWRLKVDFETIDDYFNPGPDILERHLLSQPIDNSPINVKIPRASKQNDPIFTTSIPTTSNPEGNLSSLDQSTLIDREPRIKRKALSTPTKTLSKAQKQKDCTISAEIEEYKYRIDFLKARKQLMVSVKSDGFTKTYDLNDTAGWKEINTGTKRFAEEEIKLLLEIEGKYLSLRYMENEQELCSFKLEE